MAISTLVTINQITNRDFKSLLNIFRLKQVITEPTRTTEASSNLIDLIITNRPENITSKVVFVNSIADHEMITCSRKINIIRYNPKTVECRNYTNCSPEKLRSNVVTIDWSPVYDATDVGLAVHYFISSLQVVFRTHVPHIEEHVKTQPNIEKSEKI